MHGTSTYVNRSFSDTFSDGFYRFIHSSFQFRFHGCLICANGDFDCRTATTMPIHISRSTLFIFHHCCCCCCYSSVWNLAGSCQMHSIESMTRCLQLKTPNSSKYHSFLIYVIEKQNFVFINFIFTTDARTNNKTCE